MKITAQQLTDEALSNRDYNDAYSIIVDGKNELTIRDGGEPEDMRLGRNLNFVFRIVPLMRLAFEAGKRGEEFEVVDERVDDID